MMANLISELMSQTINRKIKVIDPCKVSTTEIYGDVDFVSLLKESFADGVVLGMQSLQ